MDFKWFKNRYIAFVPWLPFLIALTVLLSFFYKLSQKKMVYRLKYPGYYVAQNINFEKIICQAQYSNLLPDISIRKKKMAKKAVPETKKIKIHLKGILDIDDNKIAIINGFAYHEGDLITPKASLIEIENNYVLITINQKIKKVTLGESLEVNET